MNSGPRATLGVALVLLGTTPSQNAMAQDVSPHWREKGCDHFHRSVVARKRVEEILTQLKPLTKDEGRRVAHYVSCVKTKNKARSVGRLRKELRAWRRRDPARTIINNWPLLNGHLASIASCESGGSPTAVSDGGTYRGKYQFDYGTWGSVGGSGDPAAATEIEQDYRAILLYRSAGPGRWPVCQY